MLMLLPFRAAALAAASLLAVAAVATAQDRIPDEPSPPVYAPSLPPPANATVVTRPPTLPVVTLREAIILAYSMTPELLAERANLRATDFRLPQARSAYGPTLDFQASQGYQRDTTELLPNRFIKRQGWANSASLIFNQPIFTFGRLRARENAARAEIALGRDSLRLQEAQTLLDVVTAYVLVQRDVESVRIAQENLDLLGRQYRDSTERFRVREITSTDLQQIETRVEVGRAQLVESQGRLGASRAQFLQAVGAEPGAVLAAPEPLPIGAPTLEQAYAYAEVNSPLIRAAQSREKISRANIDAARADTGPTVSLRGTGNYGTVSPYSSDLRTTSLRGEVVLSQPLIDSGLRSANLRAAREVNESDWRLIDQAFRDTRQGVAAAWSQLTAAALSAENYRRAEDAARRAYEGALEQEKAGARTTLDVLDLLRDLLNVQLNRVSAETNEYVARANLLASMGRLEGPLLVPGIEAYDPTRHFERVRSKGDIPLLTPGISALDGLFTRDNSTDRPIRDPAGPLRTEAPVLNAEPALPAVTRR